MLPLFKSFFCTFNPEPDIANLEKFEGSVEEYLNGHSADDLMRACSADYGFNVLQAASFYGLPLFVRCLLAKGKYTEPFVQYLTP